MPVRNGQDLRRTRKINFEGNNRIAGNTTGEKQAGYVYDPENKPRPTMKETFSIEARTGNYVGADGGYVFDPNDVARTTIKETQIHDTRTGNYVGADGGHVYDPNQVARTTIKETQIHDTRTGNMVSADGGYVYDPNNKPRTTGKETLSDKTRLGSKGIVGAEATYARNEDIAKNTHRQTTESDYTGNAGLDGGTDGYKIEKVVIPGTNRQLTSDIEYTGGAGSAMVAKETSRRDARNMLINNARNDQLRGYFAGQAAPNKIVGEESVNATTKRYSDIDAASIQERGLNAPVSYNQNIPGRRSIGIQRSRMNVPNEMISNRLDAGMLDALRSNPYSKSLHSSVL